MKNGRKWKHSTKVRAEIHDEKLLVFCIFADGISTIFCRYGGSSKNRKFSTVTSLIEIIYILFYLNGRQPSSSSLPITTTDLYHIHRISNLLRNITDNVWMFQLKWFASPKPYFSVRLVYCWSCTIRYDSLRKLSSNTTSNLVMSHNICGTVPTY